MRSTADRPLSTSITKPAKPTTVPAQPSSSSTYRPSSSSSSSSSGAVSSSTSPDNSGAGAGANWMSPSQHTRSVQPHPQSPVPAHVQTKHDQAAALMGLLAASGLTMDSLFAMGEEKQREALIAAATKNNSSRHSDSFTGATGSNGSSKSSGGSGNVSTSGTVTDKNGSDHRSASDSSSGSGSGTTNSETSSSSSLPAAPKAVAVDPRKAMMEMLAKRSKAASGEAAEDTPPAPPAASGSVTPPSASKGIKLKDDPKYSKYFKMIKVRVSLSLNLSPFLFIHSPFLLYFNSLLPFPLILLFYFYFFPTHPHSFSPLPTSLTHFLFPPFLTSPLSYLPPFHFFTCSLFLVSLFYSTPLSLIHSPYCHVGWITQTSRGTENVFRRRCYFHRCWSGITGPRS